MKMLDVIDKVSEMYRAERDYVSALEKERVSVYRLLCEAEETYGENITVARYQHLKNRFCYLEKEIELKTLYCEGISCVREMLMDMGFDAEVE